MPELEKNLNFSLPRLGQKSLTFSLPQASFDLLFLTIKLVVDYLREGIIFNISVKGGWGSDYLREVII